jgi:hypothetical protein
MHLRFLLPLLGLTLIGAGPMLAQPAPSPSDTTMQKRRPIPYPIAPPQGFQRAVAQGTRTRSGKPGPNYWTNTAHYTLDATLDPVSEILQGTARIRYVNHSPDTLDQLVLYLRQNIYKSGALRNRTVDVTGGMRIESARLAGESLQMLDEEPKAMGTRSRNAYVVDDTRMTIYPRAPVQPGDTTTVEIDYHFAVPGKDNFRMGQDGETFFLGYWYPQMAVYDDVHGWRAQPYQGDGEFYMGYASYDVALTVPEGWLVAATGTLENADAVLPDTVQKRLDRARQSDEIVSVVGADERGAGTATVDTAGGELTWRYHADRVRDVAFGTSDQYVWDATRAETGNGRVLVHSFYRPEKELWARSAEYARFSVAHLSDLIRPYPYPHMTVVDGIPVGGMEYPMITIIGGDYDPQGLFSVTYHEISHMWIPMLVGTDEKTHAWMDEGMTEFNESEGMDNFYDDFDAWAPANQQTYYRYAGTPNDAPSMRHADRYPVHGPERVYASYSKPRVMLHALRAILGEETFFEAYRTFFDRWTHKHPTPYDFFNTVEDVAGRELDWFWRGAFYESWALDQAIASVETTGDGVVVIVRDERRLPLPVLLEVTYADGRTVERRVGVAPWLKGKRTVEVTLPPGTVTRVQIDPEQRLPDVDRSDNVWTTGD